MKDIINPWLNIEAEEYEKHMSHSSVLQNQKLNKIVKEQYTDYLPEKVVYFGICTGNGLEHFNPGSSSKIYGIDINRKYLDICCKHYSELLPGLTLVELDLNNCYFEEDQVDFVIANLFLEYVSIKRFFNQLLLLENGHTVISVVIQLNNSNSFVSDSGVKALDILSGYHKDIKLDNLEKEIDNNKYHIIKRCNFTLPGNKELLRIDFKKV